MSAVPQVIPPRRPADREIIRGPSSTETRIFGTLNQVLSEIEIQFIEYPAQGYGTMVKGIVYRDGDKFEARVTRANSCE